MEIHIVYKIRMEFRRRKKTIHFTRSLKNHITFLTFFKPVIHQIFGKYLNNVLFPLVNFHSICFAPRI